MLCDLPVASTGQLRTGVNEDVAGDNKKDEAAERAEVSRI